MVDLRRAHIIDIARMEGRLLKEGRIEAIALAACRWEEGEVTVVQVRRQVV